MFGAVVTFLLLGFLLLLGDLVLVQALLVFRGLEDALTAKKVFQGLLRLVREVPVLDVLLVRLDEGLALRLQVGDLGRRLVPKLLGHPQVDLNAFGDEALEGSKNVVEKCSVTVQGCLKNVLKGKT